MKYYSDHAESLFSKYRALDAGELHAGWTKYLPETPGLACDIGAGSGRDSNWLASLGWDVIAVEPTAELRSLAEKESHPSVTWLDDQMPELRKLRTMGYRFQLILLSAVWMHVPERKRERAFRILSELLAPGGILVISLRSGGDEQENRARGFHPVNAGELQQFANQRAIALMHRYQQADGLGREHVKWETVLFQLPDDGTGSLPLLRHIIVNDDKAATYKLGLLRALIRIAEGAPGMVLNSDDDFVTIPFGLVGLYWLKLYMPLVLQHNLIQSPRHNPAEEKGLGFAKAEHFYQLRGVSPYDLRIGATFSPEVARILIGAINDACKNIKDMPAHFITYPGQPQQIFECDRASVKARSQYWQINVETLSRFGSFRVPRVLWQSLGQFACWLEPAILREWVGLMMGYEIGYGLRYDRSVYDKALDWDEGKRDTTMVRKLIEDLRLQGHDVQCVWTATRLKDENYQVDHCFPWSRWFNNDLWNLLPASAVANAQKGEKLPSASLMHDARERIIQWWQDAYLEGAMGERFGMEAEAALPLVSTTSRQPGEIFEAVMHQRAKLKANQQLAEWR